jgi:UDP-glucose 4-epimerase
MSGFKPDAPLWDVPTLRSRRVLVVGGGGFIGRNLCRALTNIGSGVAAAVNRRDASVPPAVEQYAADVRDASRVRQVTAQVNPDVVVHLAGSRSRSVRISEFRDSYATNLGGTLNVLEACLALPRLPKFVFLGSCEEYGASGTPFTEAARELPLTAYGASKLAATELLRSVACTQGLPAVILRPSNVYGPGQTKDMFVPQLAEALLSGKQFEMSAGEQTRDFVYIEDVVEAILLAMATELDPGAVINISSGIPVRIKDLAFRAASCVSPTAADLLRVGARQYRDGEIMDSWASNSLAALRLRWAPRTSLDSGLRRTIAAARKAISSE